MIKRYLKFVKPYRYRIIATIIVGIIKFGIPMLIPLLIKYAIDGVINNHSLSNSEKFSHLAIAIGIALFILSNQEYNFTTSSLQHNHSIAI